jgi:hypothetical protein
MSGQQNGTRGPKRDGSKERLKGIAENGVHSCSMRPSAFDCHVFLDFKFSRISIDKVRQPLN